MAVLFDVLLVLISTIILYYSYKNVIFNKKSSISSLIIIVIYIFNVFPIILNYCIGIPEYNTVYWYKPFIKPMNNQFVNVIYDIYILLSLICLFKYSKKYYKKNMSEIDEEKKYSSYQVFFNNNIFCFLAILSPVILVIITGTWKNYLTYNISATRGLSETTSSLMMTPMLLLSIFTFFSKFYNDKKITIRKIILSLIYFFFVVWFSGKRFMIANLTILLIFYISKSEITIKARKAMFRTIPLLFVGILLFSSYYLTVVRPLKNTSFDSVYDMLRVDFGRDDVVKYVIDEEIIKDNRILEYRCESFVSLFLFMVPRTIWPNKPYPHYMYLTGHLLDLDILNLPAGTTPSWYEMCICNFGILGIILGIIILPLICKIADKTKSNDSKAIWLILIIVLLTQSMDAYIMYIFILFIIGLIDMLFKGKKIIIKIGR